MNHDFTISFQGTISILYPKSTAAVEWIDEHVPTYTAWCGGVVIDHRYVGDIVNGIHDAGLVIDGVVDTRVA